MRVNQLIDRRRGSPWLQSSLHCDFAVMCGAPGRMSYVFETSLNKYNQHGLQRTKRERKIK